MLSGIYLNVQQCFLNAISIGGMGTHVGLFFIHGGPQ